MKLIERYELLVARFGSQDATADALDIKQPSVNAWLKGKTVMSPLVATRAERVTEGEFKAIDLCPALREPDHAAAS
jgi:DNA-binding transcriptional regulator YdaS (Cro superfamily)